jgi:hypothetical protein
MKAHIRVVLEEAGGGEQEHIIVADSRDIRKAESEFNYSWMTTPPSFIQSTQLAYVTMRRQGTFKGSYKDFDEVCVEVEDAPDPEPPSTDPTQPDPGVSS